MIEFVAFAVVVAQLLAVSQKRLRLSWALCLAACGLYLLVATEKGMFWMGVQQLVIGAIALNALRRL